MDANNNIIPIVEGDQGEGFKDIFEADLDEMKRDIDEQRDKSMQHQRNVINKGKIH